MAFIGTRTSPLYPRRLRARGDTALAIVLLPPILQRRVAPVAGAIEWGASRELRLCWQGVLWRRKWKGVLPVRVRSGPGGEVIGTSSDAVIADAERRRISATADPDC